MALINLTKPNTVLPQSNIPRTNPQSNNAQQPQTNKQLVHDFSTCPRCNSPTAKARTVTGQDSQWWYKCTNGHCQTYINTYRPMPHQDVFHRTQSRFKLNAGGFGSAKTSTDREELYKHIFLTPNGNGLVGANIAPQYEQTILRDILTDCPGDFILTHNTQKSYIDFINGYRLLFRPLDDPGKHRSLNLDFILIIEASEVKDEVEDLTRHRLRSTAATRILPQSQNPQVNQNNSQEEEQVADWRQVIYETNPENNWVKHRLLWNASTIHYPSNSIPEPDYNKITRSPSLDPNLHAFLTPTSANIYLPVGYAEDLAKNRPVWWVRRMLNSSFEYREGLVYPEHPTNPTPSFNPPLNFPIYASHDYGLHDPSVFLFATIDPRTQNLIFFREFYKPDCDIDQLARTFKQLTATFAPGQLKTPLIDPRSCTHRDYHKEDLLTLYRQRNLNFKPGIVSKDIRIMKSTAYFRANKVRITEDCPNLILELKDYKWKQQNGQDYTDKPVDKFDHAISAMEWIICELPANPNDLQTAFDSFDLDLKNQAQAKFNGWQLADLDSAGTYESADPFHRTGSQRPGQPGQLDRSSSFNYNLY